MLNQEKNISVEGSNKLLIYLSPVIIIIVNIIVAVLFGKIIGKWAFLPIILIEWCLFAFFISKSGQQNRIKIWLSKPRGSLIWLFLSILISSGTLLIFIKHYELLDSWKIIVPWLLIALINPFMEEFYWRGLLLDYTTKWKSWLAVIITSLLFASNHYVFAIHSELFRGLPVFVSTFLMGVVWAITYQKTKSLVWTILAHFLVDFLNLSVPSFLDLYKAGW
jgi:membrane protease YdiL (CAAX protease family)